jgi:hypothetical protein
MRINSADIMTNLVALLVVLLGVVASTATDIVSSGGKRIEVALQDDVPRHMCSRILDKFEVSHITNQIWRNVPKYRIQSSGNLLTAFRLRST